MKTDFKTWKRQTLEEFARDVADENKVLRELVHSLHEAWRKEILNDPRGRSKEKDTQST